MGVAVTLKSKMAPGSASSGGNSRLEQFYLTYLKAQTNRRTPTQWPSTYIEHVSLLPFKFPASGNYDAMLDSFVTTTPTMDVQAVKALFDVIMHKVY